MRDASGSPMSGGTRGASVRVCLPVMGTDESCESLYQVTCSALWGIEITMPGLDMVIGYPFLSLFRLMVDPVSDCLRFACGDKPPASGAVIRAPSLPIASYGRDMNGFVDALQADALPAEVMPIESISTEVTY